jgi:hypothetical protein
VQFCHNRFGRLGFGYWERVHRTNVGAKSSEQQMLLQQLLRFDKTHVGLCYLNHGFSSVQQQQLLVAE